MITNRLIVLGASPEVESFRESKWERSLAARYCEIMERSKGRSIFDFKTEAIPIEQLRKLSGRWPALPPKNWTQFLGSETTEI